MITARPPKRAGRRKRATPAATAVCAAALAAAAALAGQAREPFFAEPVTGSKVSAYRVELPLDTGRSLAVEIPADCQDVLTAVASGRPRNATVVQRRIWLKVEGDCRYHAFLSRYAAPALEDHVSGYDFRNARIADLPVDLRCATGRGAGCDPLETDRHGRLRFFPLGEPLADTDQPVRADCALANGLFRGRLFVTGGGEVRCEPGRAKPTLRLLTVDFADVDGDRVLDAVLRFVPLGHGAPKGPLVLALTRSSVDQGFTVPDFQLEAILH